VRTLGFLVCCLLVAGCGAGERQDAGEPRAAYDVRVVTAAFPSRQSLSSPVTMRIVVRNQGRRRVPDVAVSLGGLSTRNPQPGIADPMDPVWVVTGQPTAGVTAYDATWALGPLEAGGQKRLEWQLTPVVAGTHTVTWTVAAGLTGRSIARGPDGQRPAGTFTVRVSDAPAQGTVDPPSGAATPTAA
jgi:hypothetical protein